jgi:hypothetical protein
MQLADWILYGKRDELNEQRRRVRTWLREARGRTPVIKL